MTVSDGTPLDAWETRQKKMAENTMTNERREDRTEPAALSMFPKQRPELPEAYRKIYTQECKLNRGGQTLATKLTMWLEGWMHRIVARRGRPGSILEIGAGSLNHVPYETGAHPLYDAIEPFEPLYSDSPHRASVRRIFPDIRDVPKEARYDRVLSIAVLEHLERLPEILARSAMLLEDGGIAQHAIPSEGGFLWGLAWRMTTGIAYRLRNDLAYDVLMRYEHINDEREILSVLRWFFERIEIRRFPLPFFHLSFYTYIEASRPRLDRCKAYLS